MWFFRFYNIGDGIILLGLSNGCFDMMVYGGGNNGLILEMFIGNVSEVFDIV